METSINSHVNLLGLKAKDKVTGFTGVIEIVYFDLYGCIQVVLRPPVNDKGESPDGKWFDASRMEIISNERVMKMPDYDKGYVAEGNKGPAEKPSR